MLDLGVNRRKFDREVMRVTNERMLLESRGLFLVGATFPNIDVLVLPENALVLQIFQPVQSQLVLFGPPRLTREEKILSLTSRPFVCRFGLEDFDLLPPSISFLNPVTRMPLAQREIPRGHVMNGSKAEQVVLDNHPITKQSFLCVRGVREYHSHPQHTGDDWFMYRTSIGVIHLLDVVWRACVKMSTPLLRIQPNGLEFTWGAPKI